MDMTLLKYVKLLYFLIFTRSSYGIIGGKQASLIHWPSYVVVKHITNHYCGGSIFQPNWAITSAQCVDPNFVPKIFLHGVGVGISSLKKTKSGFFISKEDLLITSHPQFYIDDFGMTKNDIALIKLPPSTLVNHEVPLVQSVQDVEAVSTCYTAGFGMNNILVYHRNLSFQDSFHPERLLFEVEQKIVQLSDCISVLQTLMPTFNRLDDTMHLCATGVKEKAGPTFGDFGSPLICGDYQVGVASMSVYNPNVTDFLYTIYTRTAPYHIWINNVIALNRDIILGNRSQEQPFNDTYDPDDPEMGPAEMLRRKNEEINEQFGYPSFSLRNPYESDISRYKQATQEKINLLTGGSSFADKIKPNIFIIPVVFLNKILFW